MSIKVFAGLLWIAGLNLVQMLFLWWNAAFAPEWTVRVCFSCYHEQWIEGVLLHLSVVVLGWTVWQYRRDLRRLLAKR